MKLTEILKYYKFKIQRQGERLLIESSNNMPRVAQPGAKINLSVLNTDSKDAELRSVGGNSHMRDLFWHLAGSTQDGGDTAPAKAASAKHKLGCLPPAKLSDVGSLTISSNILTSSFFLPTFS